MKKKLNAEHGIICRLPGEKFGYFGWPTVARLDDGTLLVASSGLRSEHVCPWGKTVLNVSRDNGRTWSGPRVIQKSPLDDRDAGILNLGGNRVLASWFTSDTRTYVNRCRKWLGDEEVNRWRETTDAWTDAIMHQWLGSWIILSDDDGATWSAPIRAPVSAPHGPVRLRNGDLLYLGKSFQDWVDMEKGPIVAARSADGGKSWDKLGSVPLQAGTQGANFCEPHLVELPSGKLIGMIRVEKREGDALESAGLVGFTLVQTDSADGGQTWGEIRPLGFHGSPPHFVRHSSGALILTYGYRKAPFGQRVALSRDEGRTWDHDWIVRDDGPDFDLGYPSTVELTDGSLFSVYYQKVAGDKKCSLLWSRWQLPETR